MNVYYGASRLMSALARLGGTAWMCIMVVACRSASRLTFRSLLFWEDFTKQGIKPENITWLSHCFLVTKSYSYRDIKVREHTKNSQRAGKQVGMQISSLSRLSSSSLELKGLCMYCGVPWHPSPTSSSITTPTTLTSHRNCYQSV